MVSLLLTRYSRVQMASMSPTCEGPMAVVADFGTARYLVSTIRVTEGTLTRVEH